MRLAPGDRLSLYLVLFGRGVDYLPYFILAFRDINRIAQGPPAGYGANVGLEQVSVAANDLRAHDVVWSADRSNSAPTPHAITGGEIIGKQG